MQFITFVYDKEVTPTVYSGVTNIRLRLKWDGIRAETTFRLSAKRTSPFNLYASCVLYIRTGVSLLSRERFLYI